MNRDVKLNWVTLEPALSRADMEGFVRHVTNLATVPPFEDLRARIAAIDAVRMEVRNKSKSAITTAAVLVLADFIDQGWSCRYNRGRVQIARPLDRILDRDRIRQQLHVQRDRYLSTPPVREFVSSMERRRLWEGRWVSIFSLMRDGVELSRTIQDSDGDLRQVIKPYVQVVDAGQCCPFTGLGLNDIWRYFRCTWANRYQSVPGRSLMLLVRDAAGPNHPVIGIAAIGSSAVQISIRDKWIGWAPEDCIADLRLRATDEDVRWLLRLVENGLNELYIDDLLDHSVSKLTLGDLKRPTKEAIRKLRELAKVEKQKHFRLVNAGDHKSPEIDKQDSAKRWLLQAESPLFRSKRADLLAMLLRAKAALLGRSGTVTGQQLRSVLENPDSRQAIQSLILRAKSERVGVAVADITICGAVAPYSHLLGGKLVAMMVASPEVITAYHRRYARYESVIASSLAGRAVIRRPHLVFLGTTSLYGTEPTQYTRIQVPCDRLGGDKSESLRYRLLGSTCGFGTFQFSDEAVEAIGTALSQTSRGRRVNSIFGEGTSPRMRKIRDGLDLLNFPSDELLMHGNSRLVYGVSLVRNLKRFLLGQDLEPEYLVPMENPSLTTEQIAQWWIDRWLRQRITRPEILDQIASDRLTYPIKHPARVVIQAAFDQAEFAFDD